MFRAAAAHLQRGTSTSIRNGRFSSESDTTKLTRNL